MGKVKLWVDGTQIEAEEGQSVLNAALAADIYIPHICSHPDLEAQGTFASVPTGINIGVSYDP